MIITGYKKRKLTTKPKNYWGKLFAVITIYCLILVNIVTAVLLYNQAQTRLIKKATSEGKVALIEIATTKVLLGQLKPYLPHLKDNTVLKVDNLTWRVRKVGDDDKHKARISLVIGGLGLSKEYTLQALSLTPLFTLGFSPYANNVQDWVEQSVYKGFETILHLPMQQADYPTNDPGVLAMLNNSSIGENLSKLDSILSRSNKIIGLYSEKGEVFSNSHDAFLPILEEMHKQHLIYLNANADNAEWLNKAAGSVNMELQTADIIISNELSEDELPKALDNLLNTAKSKGKAVAIIRPYPFLLDKIDIWINNIDRTQYTIVPLSNQFLWEDHNKKSAVKLDTQISNDKKIEQPADDKKIEADATPVEKAITAINEKTQQEKDEKEQAKNQPTLVHE